MTAKYIFRLDDISEYMDSDKYKRVRDIFIKYGVQPIIGVIPDNQDKELLIHDKCDFDFWSEIRSLQNEYNWSIALHGHTHVFETQDSGMFKKCPYSEFAGLSKEKQNKKIKSGKSIFEKEQIKIDAFMAPAHSMDITTVDCLKENGIHTVTDGKALYPYYFRDVLFVPQLFERPRKFPFGVYTWCLHTNSMTEEDINHLEKFIIKNQKNIIPFSDSNKYVISDINSKIQYFFVSNTVRFLRRLKNSSYSAFNSISE